ncbi:MAG: hypothetical protein ABW224_14790 [Kibdelosporangium sp.]
MPATYFLAELDCPVCGSRSPADESTELVTPLVSGGPTFWTVGESDPEFNWATIAVWYPVLKVPQPGEPEQLLETWVCPACGSLAWARITFDDTVIKEITAVPLDLPTVGAAHAISSEIEPVYREITGKNLFTDRSDRTGFRDRLLDALRR